MALRVVLADDNFLVRQGTAALLAEVDGVEVVDVAEEPAGLLAAVAAHSPDAVLTDLRMPPTFSQEGIEAAKERSGAGTRGRAWSSCRSTSSPTTSSTCCPTASRGWATCSRSG